jgi:hypothetical protein
MKAGLRQSQSRVLLVFEPVLVLLRSAKDDVRVKESVQDLQTPATLARIAGCEPSAVSVVF